MISDILKSKDHLTIKTELLGTHPDNVELLYSLYNKLMPIVKYEKNRYASIILVFNSLKDIKIPDAKTSRITRVIQKIERCKLRRTRLSVNTTLAVILDWLIWIENGKRTFVRKLHEYEQSLEPPEHRRSLHFNSDQNLTIFAKHT